MCIKEHYAWVHVYPCVVTDHLSGARVVLDHLGRVVRTHVSWQIIWPVLGSYLTTSAVLYVPMCRDRSSGQYSGRTWPPRSCCSRFPSRTPPPPDRCPPSGSNWTDKHWHVAEDVSDGQKQFTSSKQELLFNCLVYYIIWLYLFMKVF